MRVSEWGNSLAVRLPYSVVEALKLKAGDEIEIVASANRKFQISKNRTPEQVLASMRKLARPLPPAFRFDREETNRSNSFLDSNILIYAFAKDVGRRQIAERLMLEGGAIQFSL